MNRDPAFFTILRDAMRQAARDLQAVKFTTSDEAPKVARLLTEMRGVLFKDCARFAKEAHSESSKAKHSSARHSSELIESKRRSKAAAEKLQEAKARHIRKR